MEQSRVPPVADKLLPACGFDPRHARYFLPVAPALADVADAMIIVATARGGMQCEPLPCEGWVISGESIDPREIATGLYPHAKPTIAAGTDVAETHNAAAANNKIRLTFDLII